jgi:DNA-binding transcriptional ArsR family regulator
LIDAELVPVVAARFRALGEPGRLELLQHLLEGERSVGELVEATGRSQPNVSQHLAQLLKAGLVEARREGSRVFYKVVDPYLTRICDAVCQSLAVRARVESRRLEAFTRTTRAKRPRRASGATSTER